MSDNQTYKLRKLLDECGIEYKAIGKRLTYWNYDGSSNDCDDADFIADEQDGYLTVGGLTPEQAIAATLGSGTLTAEQICRAVYAHSIHADCTDADWQAIADELNKLGNERELIDLAHNAWSMALCAMQGMPIPAGWGNAVEHGLRKYGIDVDAEKDGFEVSDDEW